MSDTQDTITLSTGVVLRLMRPSRYIVQEKLKQMTPKQPKVPKVYIQDKDVWEENPADPEYVEAAQQWNLDWARASENSTLFMGTAVESLPEGFSGPDDEVWAAEIRDGLGMEIPASKMLRYCLWLKCWAAPLDSDANLLRDSTNAILGIPQRKVDEAAESFRGGEERDTDLGTQPEA